MKLSHEDRYYRRENIKSRLKAILTLIFLGLVALLLAITLLPWLFA